jgi:hypothetical protein
VGTLYLVVFTLMLLLLYFCFGVVALMLLLKHVTKSDLGIYKPRLFIDPQLLTFNEATSHALHVQCTFVSRQGCFSHDF